MKATYDNLVNCDSFLLNLQGFVLDVLIILVLCERFLNENEERSFCEFPLSSSTWENKVYMLIFSYILVGKRFMWCHSNHSTSGAIYSYVLWMNMDILFWGYMYVSHVIYIYIYISTCLLHSHVTLAHIIQIVFICMCDHIIVHIYTYIRVHMHAEHIYIHRDCMTCTCACPEEKELSVI